MILQTQDILQRLKQQRNKLNARIQQHEAQEKAQQRKHDLQRKILVGTYMLEQAHQEGNYEQLLQKLDDYLTRENDRKLFDLPVRTQNALALAELTTTTDTET